MMQLQDQNLLRQACYIDGAWAPADSGATLPVTNPATGERLGTIPAMGTAETRRAIAAAATRTFSSVKSSARMPRQPSVPK